MKPKASDLWLEYLTAEGMCGLCANSGTIDTHPLKRYTPGGAYCGVTRYCICPNGRALAEQDEGYKAKHWPQQPEVEDDELPTNEQPDVEKALEIARNYSQIDGAHHKGWCIDQMVRALTGVRYQEWVEDYEEADENGEKTYEWDTGIAP